MAKPRPVAGVRTTDRLRPNARRILAVRIEEVFQYDGTVADPTRVTELHDMRIACKRLRYLLEIFDIAFRADLDPFLEQVKDLQDILGDIHDRDVQVPMLEAHLEWLDAREAQALAATVAAPARRLRGTSHEAAFERFRAQIEGAWRSDERPGIHALIAIRREQREALYARFLDEWRQMKRQRFRARLEAALGIAS
jgi:CHAD domain-containing protein